MLNLVLKPTRCAICDTEGNATELYPARFDERAFNPAVFSARRLPDRLHYRLVKCRTCGLVRSDPAADPEVLAPLYAQSTFGYATEIPNLRRTYGRYLARLARYRPARGTLLEVGCGNGFFLEEAQARGYAVRGVEPSRDAVARADPSVRPYLVCDLMRPGLFGPEEFDVICLFQVLDHVPDPATLLAECLRTLKPGGLILSVNHNVEAASARLLGERSPIVDVEHTYLYGPATMRRLFQKHGFQVEEVGTVWNRYALSYLARLVPLPARLKAGLLAVLSATRLGRLPLSVPLGNLFLVASKPAMIRT